MTVFVVLDDAICRTLRQTKDAGLPTWKLTLVVIGKFGIQPYLLRTMKSGNERSSSESDASQDVTPLRPQHQTLNLSRTCFSRNRVRHVSEAPT